MTGIRTQSAAGSSRLPAPGGRLLVVGAGSMRASAFGTWHRMGLEIVLADGHSAARYEQLADEFAALDTRDGTSDLAALTDLARTCQGVVTLSDDAQRTVAHLCDKLALPGTGSAAAAAARSKLVQRTICERRGVAVPRWCHAHSEQALEEFFAHGPRKAVLKPADSAGSSGVLRVGSLGDAVKLWPIARSLSPSHTVLIEEFIEGQEVCIDAVVAQGAVRFVSVSEKEVRGPDGFVVVSLGFAAHQPKHAAAEKAVQTLVSALDLQDGIVHAEFKVDGDRWCLVETAFRPGGDLIADLTARVTGVNLYEAQARLALDAEPFAHPSETGTVPYAQIRFLVADGQVRSFVPPATLLRNLPEVQFVKQLADPGQRVRIPLGNSGRAAYAVGWGPDRVLLDTQLREALARLGEGMGLTAADEPAAAGAV